MNYSDYDDECTAAPGLFGTHSCHKYPGCGCGGTSVTRDEPDTHSYPYSYGESSIAVTHYVPYKPKLKKLKLLDIVHRTAKAVLFRIRKNDLAYEVWVPNVCVKKLKKHKLFVTPSFYRSSIKPQIENQIGEARNDA